MDVANDLLGGTRIRVKIAILAIHCLCARQAFTYFSVYTVFI